MLFTISDSTFTRKPLLLRKDRSRPDCGRRHAAGAACWSCAVGRRRQVAWQGAMEATLFSAWIYDT